MVRGVCAAKRRSCSCSVLSTSRYSVLHWSADRTHRVEEAASQPQQRDAMQCTLRGPRERRQWSTVWLDSQGACTAPGEHEILGTRCAEHASRRLEERTSPFGLCTHGFPRIRACARRWAMAFVQSAAAGSSTVQYVMYNGRA